MTMSSVVVDDYRAGAISRKENSVAGEVIVAMIEIRLGVCRYWDGARNN